MIFGHRGTRRRFLPYLSGTTSADEARNLEIHLGRCPACRAAFARLKKGHRLAAKLARIEKAAPLALEEGAAAPPFTAALIAARCGGLLGRKWNGIRLNGTLAFAAPRTVWILAVVVAAQMALLGVFNWSSIFGNHPSPKTAVFGIDLNGFQALDIADIPLNAHPHIATEGYVRKVWMDAEEKTLHFKLASSPEGEGPYVICEILNPERISAPRAGNRVRVYGLARYDAQIGRQWHEVNPVLDISVLKR